MRPHHLALLAATLLTACVPSRLGFGRANAQTLEPFLRSVIEQSGGNVTACQPGLSEDSRFRHLCATVPAPFERFQPAWEAALAAAIKESDARLETLYGGWRDNAGGVFVNFYGVGGREVHLVYAARGNAGGVILAVDTVGN